MMCIDVICDKYNQKCDIDENVNQLMSVRSFFYVNLIGTIMNFFLWQIRIESLQFIASLDVTWPKCCFLLVFLASNYLRRIY